MHYSQQGNQNSNLILFFVISLLSFYSISVISALPFTENRGQIIGTDGRLMPNVHFVHFTPKLDLYLTNSGFSYVFKKNKADDTTTGGTSIIDSAGLIELYRMDMRLEDFNENCKIIAESPLGYSSNYYYPHCPDGITGVRTYQRVTYSNVYDNIDMVCYGSDDNLKYEFIVKPGGKVEDIKIRFDGTKEIEILTDGSLSISNPLGIINESKPITYQRMKLNGQYIQSNVSSEFLIENNTVQFNVGEYDKTKELVIDPDVSWITYVGGSSTGSTFGVAVDDRSNTIVTGLTQSTDFPVTTGAFQDRNNGRYDIYLMKFDDNDQLLWSTYIGGNSQDYANCVEVKGDAIWISGETRSSNFPVTNNAYQRQNNGGTADIVLIKFQSDGILAYATYYGGKGYDTSPDLAIDSRNNVWLTGMTASFDFPVTSDAYQSDNNNSYDPVLVKFDENGNRLYATFFGGSSNDYGDGITINNNDVIAMSGLTKSYDFPITNDAYQSINNGQVDAFISTFDISGNLIWSSYYGGSGNDYGSNITSDDEGNFIIHGYTSSTDLPVSTDAYQNTLSGSNDAFIAKFATSNDLLWATYFGGSRLEGRGSTMDYQLGGITTNTNNDILFTGVTQSGNFPSTTDAFQQALNGPSDAYLSKLDKYGNLVWSSFIGGNGGDRGIEVAFYDNNNYVCVGTTQSSDFPVTDNAFQKQIKGSEDGFIFKFGEVGDCIIDLKGFSSTTELEFVGSSQGIEDTIIMTPPVSNISSAVWLRQKVSFGKGFTTKFQFRMTDGANGYNDGSIPGADGVVFVVQNAGSDVVGGIGGGIGFEGIPNSIAIEFDTYWNYTRKDPNGNHVAIFSNGNSNNSSDHSTSANLATNSDILELIPDGRTYFVKIKYDHDRNTLRVFVDSTGRYNNLVLEVDSLDIPSLLDLNQDCYGFMGFTSATGDSWEKHELLGWEICTNPCSLLDVEAYENKSVNVKSYPNPATESIYIEFELEHPASVRLIIYDLLGNKQAVLVDEFKDSGNYKIMWNTQNITNGIYIFKLAIDNSIETGRIIISK